MTPSLVYIIYSADVLSETSRFIDEMSPAQHMPAGFHSDSEPFMQRAAIAAKFTLTEGDDQYDYGYLGSEYNPPRIEYFPYGYLDKEATVEPPEDYEGPTGSGQHRKWVGELTWDEWLVFADSYVIDLDSQGIPERYEETLGSLTVEYGHIPAMSVDNAEGWDSPGCRGSVIDSGFYISFAGDEPQ